jgi:hypothetical protein
MRGLPALLLAGLLAACSGGDDAARTRTVAYSCDGGVAFRAVFNPVSRIATLLDLADAAVLLPARAAEEGFLYANGGVSLRGEGDSATLGLPDGRRLGCRAVSGAGGEG